MNLHRIVRGAVGRVNPDTIAILQKNIGYGVNSSGDMEPLFSTDSGPIQVQALTGKDLAQVNFLNIQGVLRKIFIPGNWTGVVRADSKGGDILTFPQVPGGDDQDWMIFTVFETWPDWSSVGVVLQAEVL